MTQSNSIFDKQMIRHATWGASLLTAAGLLFVVVGFAIAEINSWKDYILLGAPAMLFILGLTSIVLLRRGKLFLGTSIIFVANLIVPLTENFLQKGIGTAIFIYILVSSALLIWRSLPKTSYRWASILTGAALLSIIVIEIIKPSFRISPADELVAFIFLMTALLTVSFIFQAVRETWGQSMRNKLLVALIATTLVTAGILSVYMFITTTNTLRQSLEAELTQHTDGVARQISALFDEQIASITALSMNERLQEATENANRSYTGSASAVQAILKARDEQWQAADAARNDNDPLVWQLLNNRASKELLEFQNRFPDQVETFITDVNGGLVASTNRTSDYYQADEAWWKAAYNNGKGAIYISEPQFDQSSGIFAIQIAEPIYEQQSQHVIGVLRTTYQTSALTPILGEVVGKTGETVLYIPGRPAFMLHQGQYDPLDPDVYNELQTLVGQGMFEMDYQAERASANAPTATSKIPSVVIQKSMKDLGRDTEFNKLGWVVLYHQSQDEAYAPITTSIRGAVIVIVIVVLLTIAAAYALSLFLVQPITQLTKTAEQIASGNLETYAKVNSTDEIGILAGTFNRMTSQLRDTLQGLEQRVAARTRDLAIVAEVGTATATILESKRLLQEVVNLTKERFNLYHSHIYLLDEEGTNLVLTAGAGEPGRIMVAEGRSIPLDRGQSLVARAARERKGVTVNDVTQDQDFLPNPLLPDTRSELAVPMIAGGRVIGVFDIQSEQVGRFTESDINIQTTLAAQLATSIQNVRSFEQSRKQAELESMVNVIGQRIQRSTSIEETLQTAVRELGNALGASHVKAKLSRREDSDLIGKN